MKTKKNKLLPSAILIFALTFTFGCSEDALPETVQSKLKWKVTESEALLVALKKIPDSPNLRPNNDKPDKEVSFIKEIKDLDGDTFIYAVNFKENEDNYGKGGGFTLVSGDKRFIPILATGDEGAFDPDQDMEGVGIWLDYVKTVYSRIKNKELNSKRLEALWKIYTSSGSKGKVSTEEPPEEGGCPPDYSFTYGPLLSTQWGQSGLYQVYSPSNSGCSCDRALAGCGPVAIAQVWNYHQKPNHFPSNCPDGSTPPCTINYPMDSQSTIEVCDPLGAPISQLELARLIKLAGEYAGSNYSYLGGCQTLTWRQDVKEAFQAASYSNKGTWDNFSGTIINNVIHDLSWGYPVIIDGATSLLAFDWHIWVIDGYKESMYFFEDENGCTGWGTSQFHLNWGQNNTYNANAWYSLLNFTDHNDNVYDYALHVTYGIRP